MTRLLRLGALTLAVLPLLAFSCAEVSVESPTYEIGEIGLLRIRNPSNFPMAVGGCTLFQERLPGRWVTDRISSPACLFAPASDGEHILAEYELIPPKQSLKIEFPTDWLESEPGVMRIIQRVSVGCDFPKDLGDPITCRRVDEIETDPVVVMKPGTSDTVSRF